MKKLNNELQESNLFQEAKVFENNRINKDIDSIYELLENNFGSVGDKLCVCGSVAKIMDGKLKEDYQPKDVDFVVKDQFYYRFLERNVHRLNVDFIIEDIRIILFFPNIVVELWVNNVAEKVKRNNGIYKNKINYSYV